ncbi:uncharacterized protein AMSG_05172 [Thecamonas trahens ATCC 50062]|uniref:Uncharacterized protein n=1 Tax=Thecamonas trahens ATCC 50062 TaxID=461836 RepID=A0A0L0DAD0_THETB|nr:hypothetical protein AMSG_05172 [Thecamonas trahens ATCC 50062]KNC49190.1 hypothetical protein AMSG_05172 [Thecamonas trahens ATCC 50062]|eukprot:XP_013758209.1 hypothetical protein AMSG_05172 [Thecamonas trahens ATCC 50062]
MSGTAVDDERRVLAREVLADVVRTRVAAAAYASGGDSSVASAPALSVEEAGELLANVSPLALTARKQFIEFVLGLTADSEAQAVASLRGHIGEALSKIAALIPTTDAHACREVALGVAARVDAVLSAAVAVLTALANDPDSVPATKVGMLTSACEALATTPVDSGKAVIGRIRGWAAVLTDAINELNEDAGVGPDGAGSSAASDDPHAAALLALAATAASAHQLLMASASAVKYLASRDAESLDTLRPTEWDAVINGRGWQVVWMDDLLDLSKALYAAVDDAAAAAAMDEPLDDCAPAIGSAAAAALNHLRLLNLDSLPKFVASLDTIAAALT